MHKILHMKRMSFGRRSTLLLHYVTSQKQVLQQFIWLKYQRNNYNKIKYAYYIITITVNPQKQSSRC